MVPTAWGGPFLRRSAEVARQDGTRSVQSLSMTLDEETRSGLVALVRNGGYERRAEPFQLSSGGWSHDYIDGKHAISSGAALRQASQAVIDAVDEDFDAVGGPTMGADALAHGVSLLSGAGWFSVRKEPKGHGRESWIEGSRLRPGDRALVVEDVVSTGASLLRAVERIRDVGVRVVAATALLDRSPQVAERFEDAGIRWVPLLTWTDLGIEPI
jgi:orotate phosphoribosyltransferase